MEDRTYGYAGDQTAETDRPALNRIAELADEAHRIAGGVRGFLDRCRGSGLADGGKAGPHPVPSGHFGELDRLTDNLSLLDKLVRELSSIG